MSGGAGVSRRWPRAVVASLLARCSLYLSVLRSSRRGVAAAPSHWRFAPRTCVLSLARARAFSSSPFLRFSLSSSASSFSRRRAAACCLRSSRSPFAASLSSSLPFCFRPSLVSSSRFSSLSFPSLACPLPFSLSLSFSLLSLSPLFSLPPFLAFLACPVRVQLSDSQPRLISSHWFARCSSAASSLRRPPAASLCSPLPLLLLISLSLSSLSFRVLFLRFSIPRRSLLQSCRHTFKCAAVIAW